MEDCYCILGVGPSASAAEIKRAFRRKAKELHPDLSSHDSAKTAAFHKLLAAYETLSDLRKRSLFDAVFGARTRNPSSENSFDYRRWLAARTDEESRCKLIFFDLMHGREEEAVREYTKISASRVAFTLADWFTREDFMDFGFILAEELIFAEEYYEAYRLLSQIIRMEYRFSYFRHFFPEVLSLIRDLLRTKLEGNISDELALDAWEDALDLELGKKDEAYFLRLMAEAYDRLGDMTTAALCLEEALRVDPSLIIPLRVRKRFGVA